MASGRLDDFFETWPEEGFPEEGEFCLPDVQLVAIARSDDQKAWPPGVSAHVESCKHCSGVIHLLKATERTPVKIYELIGRAQEKGRDTGRVSRPSVLSQAWSFFSFGQPKWAVPALATSLILLFVGWGISSRIISPNENGVVVASLEEDLYGNTAQSLKASVDKLNDPRMSLQDKRQHLKSFSSDVSEINKKLTVLTQKELPPPMRAELANLVAAYNSGVTLVQHDLAAQKNTQPAQSSKINPTADSDLVVKIYAAAYNSTSKKNVGSEDKQETEAETAKAVQEGKGEVNVVAINGNEVEVIDLRPNRSPEVTTALQHDLQQLLSNSEGHRTVSWKMAAAKAFAGNR